MMFSTMEQLAQSKLAFWVGIFGLLKLFLIFIPLIYRGIMFIAGFRLWKQIDFKDYGEWAVVTGSTDGIGKCFAIELAKRGMDIIFISRSEERLRNTAKEIELEYKVKTFCIQADFTNRDCYRNIKQELRGKDIGVLVNNVGHAVSVPTEFTNVEESCLWNEIDINCGAATMMTRMILPQMKSKRKGFIVNISSVGAAVCIPQMGIYSPTKSFLKVFTICLQQEVKEYNIKVQCLTPGFIGTKMLNDIKPFIKNIPNFVSKVFIPDPETFVKSAMDTLNTDIIIDNGYWPHAMMERILIWITWNKRINLLHKIMKYVDDYLIANTTKRKSI